jgi:hypothetical protein
MSSLPDCCVALASDMCSVFDSLRNLMAKFKFDETPDGYAVAFVEGCCLNSDGPESSRRAGLGVWFGENHPL